MAPSLIVGSVVMIGLLVAVLFASTRGRAWYRYTPQTSRDDVGWTPRRDAETAPGLLARTGTWIVAFFLVATLGIGGVFFVSASGGMSTVLLGAVAALVVVYLVGGVYLMARQRGHSNAMAVFESATASGAVFVGLIVLQLVVLG